MNFSEKMERDYKKNVIYYKTWRSLETSRDFCSLKGNISQVAVNNANRAVLFVFPSQFWDIVNSVSAQT